MLLGSIEDHSIYLVLELVNSVLAWNSQVRANKSPCFPSIMIIQSGFVCLTHSQNRPY